MFDPSRPVLIGIAGAKRSGKDTVARHLRNLGEEHDGIRFQRIAMADALKSEIADFVDREYVMSREEALAAMNGDGPAKEQFRLIMQWWGTEFRRGMCEKDYWITRHKDTVSNIMLGRKPNKPDFILIPDVRFRNEIDYIKDQGGIVILVKRPEVDDVGDGHDSENEWRSYTGWDYVIDNNDTLHTLDGKVNVLFNQIRKWRDAPRSSDSRESPHQGPDTAQVCDR